MLGFPKASNPLEEKMQLWKYRSILMVFEHDVSIVHLRRFSPGSCGAIGLCSQLSIEFLLLFNRVLDDLYTFTHVYLAYDRFNPDYYSASTLRYAR